MPWGVAEMKVGSPWTILPTLTGWKPSTSLEGWMALITFSSEMWRGRGSWTRMPSTSEIVVQLVDEVEEACSR